MTAEQKGVKRGGKMREMLGGWVGACPIVYCGRMGLFYDL